MISNIYGQCDGYGQSQCNNDNSCEWVENIEYGNCSEFNQNSSVCEATLGCYGAYQYPGWYSGWYCAGGNYQIDNSYCQEIEMPECNEEYEFQCTDGSCIPIHRVCNNINDCEDGSDEINCEDCSELLESDCSNDNNCEWLENIELENCNFAWSESNCQAHNGCEWECEMIWDSSLWEDVLVCDCYGQYQVDVGYCEEIEMPECSEMNEPQCSNDDECDWIEDINWGSCEDLTPIWNVIYYCDDPSTNLDNCYTYTCYGGGYGQWGTCCGGSPYVIADNSYCEDIPYELGDVNQDSIINIQDVIIVINLILSGGSDLSADLNLDNTVNVLDVIQLVNIILNN